MQENRLLNQEGGLLWPAAEPLTRQRVDDMLCLAARLESTGGRISFLSSSFLGIPYRARTLIGSAQEQEVFVVNLDQVDCFTFLDYVEAMRSSTSYEEFTATLQTVRYRQGIISFETRNHFFTDWREYNHKRVQDVTLTVGQGKALEAAKTLNAKEDGSRYIPGLPVMDRTVHYLPSSALESLEVAGGLMTGDYMGVYSKEEGLDVSHVGIVIREGQRLIFRHASFVEGKVEDQALVPYMLKRPAMVVLRPLAL